AVAEVERFEAENIDPLLRKWERAIVVLQKNQTFIGHARGYLLRRFPCVDRRRCGGVHVQAQQIAHRPDEGGSSKRHDPDKDGDHSPCGETAGAVIDLLLSLQRPPLRAALATGKCSDLLFAFPPLRFQLFLRLASLGFGEPLYFCLERPDLGRSLLFSIAPGCHGRLLSVTCVNQSRAREHAPRHARRLAMRRMSSSMAGLTRPPDIRESA